jgi:hypothetical protein
MENSKTRAEIEKENLAKGLVYPYCSGCGHRYFRSTMVKPEEAATSLCDWCLE